MLYHDPRWPRASAWLQQSAGETLGTLAVVGAGATKGSITPGRGDLAPGAIRKALERFSPYDVSHATDVEQIRVRDLGDLEIANLAPADAKPAVSKGVEMALQDIDALVLLGGDNSITYPGVLGLAAALACPLDRCAVLTLDAHFDLRDLDNGLTNGNPIRALLRDGLPGANIAQIGIQPFANSRDYDAIARAAGIHVITSEEAHARGIRDVIAEALANLAARADAIYVDLDLDVLDRAFAPATPGSRPGGLAPWQVRIAARECGLHPKVRVLDLVEIDPEKDISDCTVLAAASCLLSFASGLCARLESQSSAVRS